MGAGAKRPKKIFRTHPFRTHPPFRIPPLLDLIGSVVGMKRCKKTIFCVPPLRVGAKIKGGCETKGGCKAATDPPLNTPMYIHVLQLHITPHIMGAESQSNITRGVINEVI